MNAVAVADWLRTLTQEDLTAIRARLGNRHPGLLDQIAAAAAEGAAIQAATAAAVGVDVGRVNLTSGSDSILLQIVDTLTRWVGIGDPLTTCLHSPDPRHPQPVFAAAWKPNLLTCRQCLHLFRLPRGGASDRTCDHCGKVCGGVNAGDPIYSTSVVFGGLTFYTGACGACHQESTS